MAQDSSGTLIEVGDVVRINEQGYHNFDLGVLATVEGFKQGRKGEEAVVTGRHRHTNENWTHDVYVSRLSVVGKGVNNVDSENLSAFLAFKKVVKSLLT